MAHTVLGATQTETPAAEILGKAWAGEYQLLCTDYGTAPVTLEVRPRGSTTWRTASFNGTDIQLTKAGATLDIRLVRDYDYRLVTSTAGAVVVIAKHDIYE